MENGVLADCVVACWLELASGAFAAACNVSGGCCAVAGEPSVCVGWEIRESRLGVEVAKGLGLAEPKRFVGGFCVPAGCTAAAGSDGASSISESAFATYPPWYIA